MRPHSVVAWLALAATPGIVRGQGSHAARCSAVQYRFIDSGAPTTAPRHRSVQDGESYALRDSSVVDGGGIASIIVWAHATGRDTTWDVLAKLTPAGESAMTAATERNRGYVLALLLGDTILAQGVVEGKLGSRIPIRTGATHREADSLALLVRRASGAGCN